MNKPSTSAAIKQRKSKCFTESQRNELQELIEDVYVANRNKVVLTNFLRGIAFGLGTFIGGTIVVAVMLWVVSKTTDFFPWMKAVTDPLIHSVEYRK